MEKYTPGPWSLGIAQLSRDGLNGLTDGRLQDGVFAGDDIVAICGDNDANARLIAASPLLYDYAAKKASEGCEEAKSMLASLKSIK